LTGGSFSSEIRLTDKEADLAGKTVAAAVSQYGANLKPKLASIAIEGAPEDQLRAPLESLVRDLAEIGGLPAASVRLVGETTLAALKTRPDFAVTVGNALVGFIEVRLRAKAPIHANSMIRTTKSSGINSNHFRT
jgi:hypothetical protein